MDPFEQVSTFWPPQIQPFPQSSSSSTQARGTVERTTGTESLVIELEKCFASILDLYRTLKREEEALERNERRGIPPPRGREPILGLHGQLRSRRSDEYSDHLDGELFNAGNVVRQEFNRGYHRFNHQYAVGDSE